MTMTNPSAVSAERLTAGPLAAWPFLLGATMDVLLGLDLLLFAGPIMELSLVAPFDPLFLQVAGGVLLVYGIDMALVARSKGRMRRLLPLFMAANWAYVPVSVGAVLLFADHLTGLGVVLILATSVATGLLAVPQQRFMKRT